MPQRVTAKVVMRWSDPAIRQMLGAPSGMVGQYLDRLGREVATSARRRAPRRHGTLAGSIRSRVAGRGGSLQAVVEATAPHAMWVHEGTGVFGRRGRAITREGGRKVMVWYSPGGEKIVARKVKGMEPDPFMTEAMEAVIGRRSL